MITSAISQQKPQTNNKTTKDNPHWNKARFTRRYKLIKVLPENALQDAKKRFGNCFFVNALANMLRIGYAHNLIVISRENLAEKLGCSIWTAGDILHELYEIGIIHIIAQRYKDGKPTTNFYTLTQAAKDTVFVEFVFWVMKGLKRLDYFMLCNIKKALIPAYTSLLSSSYIYMSLINNIIPYKKKTFIYKKSKKEELTKHDPPMCIKSLPKCELRSEKSLTKGKTMLVNKHDSQYTHNENSVSAGKIDLRLEEFKRLCCEMAAKCNVKPLAILPDGRH
jgi:ribosomal protein S25